MLFSAFFTESAVMPLSPTNLQNTASFEILLARPKLLLLSFSTPNIPPSLWQGPKEVFEIAFGKKVLK